MPRARHKRTYGSLMPVRNRVARLLIAALIGLIVPPANQALATGAQLALGERPQDARSTSSEREISSGALPKEARETLAIIERGGPFPYRKDGSAFGNREKRLPLKAHGYYREYTVPTPGARDRGARRIVAGRDGEYYYTDDHYNSFRRIRE